MKVINVLVITIIALSTNIWPAEDCKPSKWGAGDEIGSANLVTPEQVIMASKLVGELSHALFWYYGISSRKHSECKLQHSTRGFKGSIKKNSTKERLEKSIDHTI